MLVRTAVKMLRRLIAGRNTVVSGSNRLSASMMEQLDTRCLLSSIAGLWTGSRTESGLSGTFGTVTVNMDLTQSGTQISGTERRSSPVDSEYFANLITGGTFSNDVFSLSDQSITSSKTTSNYKWLLYRATLQLSTDGQTLSGKWHVGSVHGSMTLQRVPLPLITLSAAGPHHPDGITVHYAISTADITDPLEFQVYRSSTAHLNASSLLIGSQTFSPASAATKLSIGLHRATLLSRTSLTGDKKRPYVIVVINANGKIVEAGGSINSIVFQLHAF